MIENGVCLVVPHYVYSWRRWNNPSTYEVWVFNWYIEIITQSDTGDMWFVHNAYPAVVAMEYIRLSETFVHSVEAIEQCIFSVLWRKTKVIFTRLFCSLNVHTMKAVYFKL